MYVDVMDFGNLMFDTPDHADSGMPTSEFDFYFLQSQADVPMLGVGVDATQEQQQAQQQQAQHGQTQLRRPAIHTQFAMDEDLAYLATGGPSSVSTPRMAAFVAAATSATESSAGLAMMPPATARDFFGQPPQQQQQYRQRHHHQHLQPPQPPILLSSSDPTAKTSGLMMLAGQGTLAGTSPSTAATPTTTTTATLSSTTTVAASGSLSPAGPASRGSTSSADPPLLLLHPDDADTTRQLRGPTLSPSGSSTSLQQLGQLQLGLNPTNPQPAQQSQQSQQSLQQQVHVQARYQQQQQLHKRLERRGHTKSRRGCYNCKRRRIKCQETRPACGHCLKTGLQCEYPTAPLVNHQPQHQIPLFSLQDMRFFQHFLDNCCPHYPLGNETLWTHEVPILSHSHDYLMHALLGLAASDLMQQDASLAAAAMDHRVKAIRAIKRTLGGMVRRPPPVALQPTPAALAAISAASGNEATEREDSSGETSPRPARPPPPPPHPLEAATLGSTSEPMFEEGNALMATCFALTFQSVQMDDGMAEYMTFIRGILVVALQMYIRGTRLIFRNMLGNAQVDMMASAMGPVQIDRRWSGTAVASVHRLAPLCEGDPVATAYHALVVEMAEALLVSPIEAYAAMGRHYSWWMQLPQEQFRQVIDMDRPVFVLLASHWIALKQIMARITDVELTFDDRAEDKKRPQSRKTRNETSNRAPTHTQTQDDDDQGIARWLKHLNRQVEPEYASYNEWPAWVEAELDRDAHAFKE